MTQTMTSELVYLIDHNLVATLLMALS